MVTMVNNRQQHIPQKMSRRYCQKVTKFHCTGFSGLRAVEESLVVVVVGGGAQSAKA